MNRAAEYLPETSRRERLAQIEALDLGHPDLRARLEELAQATAQDSGHPISMVNIILDNAQWTIAATGLPAGTEDMLGLPAEWSFCVHVVTSHGTFWVPDARSDERFADNPFVAVGMISSYVGVPLTAPNGEIIGSHCLLSPTPDACTLDDVERLRQAAAEISDLLATYRRPQ